MYLIKKLSTQNGALVAENGIRIIKMWDSDSNKSNFSIFNGFWGSTDIYISKLTDISKFQKVCHSLYLLSYATKLISKNTDNNSKNFKFFVDDYQPNNIEGYILFIENEKNISTDGQIIFSNSPNQIVVILKNGQYLDFSGKKATVQKDILVLHV